MAKNGDREDKRTKRQEAGGSSIRQEGDDKALSQGIENGRGIMEAADAVKAKPINQTWRTEYV